MTGNPRSPQRPRKLRLRTTLVLPFVLQIVAAVGVVGYASFWNGQKAVQSLASKLVEEIEDQVAQYLDNYTSVPHQINQVNLDAIDLGILNLEDFDAMGRYFWRQLKVFDVGYINFGNEQEAFIGAERLDDGSLMIHEAPIADVTNFYSYTTDAEGNRLSSTVEFSPEPLDDEEWYAAAVEAETAVWSEIYQWEDQPEVLSISSSYPVYDANQALLGVIGSDLILTQISTFLRNLDVEPTATIFIVEPSGLLVASSSETPLYEVEGEDVSRLAALDSPDAVIAATANRLLQAFQSFQQIDAPQELSFSLQGERQYVQAFPWQDQFGLDWLVVVTVPEAAFMGQIYANTRITILLCFAALGIAIAIGILTSRWITRPIMQVSEASDRLAQGDLDQHVPPNSLIEVNMLANSFNKMSGQLKDSFTTLEQKNEALRIAEENFRSIFENALEGIFQSSPEGRFLSVNPALAQIYGYDFPQEMIEQITDIGEQLYVDPERRTEFRDLLKKHGFAKNFEYRCYRKDGSIIWTQIDARSVKDKNGNLLYYEGIVQDITNRKRREDELKRQLEELQIEIDQKKREEEVATLTQSTYFQEVQEEISDVNLDEFWS
ncbi:MAG: PAS domain S-box protein [Leptolyngbya sp. SIO1D8]|nr:PAS domain S-box protein [Leptolyngbya sp. SIO1D8]